MNRALNDSQLVQRYAQRMQGVFAVGDLERLLNETNPVVLHRRIRALQEADLLQRCVRGIYATPGFVPEALAARINPDSYVSLGSALARELMIGSVPSAAVYSVKVGKGRTYRGAGLTLDYAGVTREMFFGFQAVDGIRCATREKALIDTLYFYLRGRRYSFNVFEDVDTSRIDPALVETYLCRYRNPRFVAFVRGFLRERQ